VIIERAGTDLAVRVLRVSEELERAVARQDVLSGGELKHVAAQVRQEDRDRYLVAHTVLRQELADRLGVRPADVELTRNPCPSCGGPHGRPGLSRGDGPYFSLSHTGDVVLLAFASTPVGIDVEAPPPTTSVASVSRGLHQREQEELADLPREERAAAFMRCWTRKEAYLKGIGVGIGGGVVEPYVSTLPRPEQPPGWRLTDFGADRLPAGYTAALAVKEKE
jgi:4'-phosphopantetheinyl transferase